MLSVVTFIHWLLQTKAIYLLGDILLKDGLVMAMMSWQETILNH